MQSINLHNIDLHKHEPRLRIAGKGFLAVPTVGLRSSAEILVLELFREIFYPADPTANSGAKSTRFLDPEFKNEENKRYFTDKERAVLYCLKGRRRETKQSNESTYYAPAYPQLAKGGWFRKNEARVINQLLFKGAIAQALWFKGEDCERGKATQEKAIEFILEALIGHHKNDEQDILFTILEERLSDQSIEKARVTLHALTKQTDSVFGTLDDNHDELACQIMQDLINICDLQKHIPRMLWVRILMTFLRFALPIWLLAKMELTNLVYTWLLSAMEEHKIPSVSEISKSLCLRNRSLITPTLTPSRAIYFRISNYMRQRIELNLLLISLERLNTTELEGKEISTKPTSATRINLLDLLNLASRSSIKLKGDKDFGESPSIKIFLARVAENYNAWRDPLKKGQGKNINEFLSVLYKAENGDEAGGHLLVRGGRSYDSGFRVFPGRLLLQVVAHLASKKRQTGGGGRLVLKDIEDHFGIYGIDFTLAADARPLLMKELQSLGLLQGSPDAGGSVEVTTPFI